MLDEKEVIKNEGSLHNRSLVSPTDAPKQGKESGDKRMGQAYNNTDNEVVPTGEGISASGSTTDNSKSLPHSFKPCLPRPHFFRPIVDNPAHTSHLEWLQQELTKSKETLFKAQQSVEYLSKMIGLVQNNSSYQFGDSETSISNAIKEQQNNSRNTSNRLVAAPESNGADKMSESCRRILQEEGRFDDYVDLPGQMHLFESVACVNQSEDLLPSSATVELNEGVELNGSSLASKRSPKQMLFPQYAEMTCIEAVSSLLGRDEEQVFTTEQIALEIYNTESKEELARVKASLRMELQRGEKKEGKWKKVEKGQWQAKSAVKSEVCIDPTT